MKVILGIFLIVACFSDAPSQSKLAKTSGIPSRTYLNANYISTILENNGISDVTE